MVELRIMIASLAVLALSGSATGCAPEEQTTSLTGPAALVITTDYQTGSYSAVRLSDHKVVTNIEVIHQDAVCRYDPLIGLPLIVARLGADAVDIVDPVQHWQVVGEYSVGAGTNPQDIAVVSADRAYVSRLQDPALLVVHPLTGEIVDEIDLTAYADTDGLAEPSGLFQLEGKVYALLLRLENMVSTGSSSLLVIDGPSGDVEDVFELSSNNPAVACVSPAGSASW